jgi:phospholipase/carboxylesterase
MVRGNKPHAAILRIGADMTIDSEAVLWSAPEQERAGRPLLVLLHGYGSNEGDLFGLSPSMPLSPVIASLRAPIDIGYGHSWFPLTAETPIEQHGANADAAAGAVLDWLETTESTSVGILGFSQGAATALQLMRLAPERFSYVVALSGFLAGIHHAGDEELTRVRPPLFWGRGTLDRVIPQQAITITEDWLPAHSSLESHIYEDVAHGVSGQEMRDINTFISQYV